MMQKPIYIIAEAGVNHNGEKDLAHKLIEIAADAGVDAVKFQTFTASKLTSPNIAKADYQKKNSSKSESQQDMLKSLELPKDWHIELKEKAEELGLDFLSTAFDLDSHNFLLELGIKKIKIPSGELTNGPLIWEIAKSNLDIIISTGMANMVEIEDALATIAHSYNFEKLPENMHEIRQIWQSQKIKDSLKDKITILHCTSQYPAKYNQVNLKAMQSIKDKFNLDVGYSDHTLGISIALAAAANGARIIEKHYTIDRNLPGPDHETSLEPDELKQMVKEVRNIEIALGDGIKKPQEEEKKMMSSARKQIVAARKIKKGSLINMDDLTSARCGDGMSPNDIWSLVGKISKNSYNTGDLINE
jgi:N-acetylneuraminate synthase